MPSKFEEEKQTKMSSTEELDELSYNSASSHSTEAFIEENLKYELKNVNSELNESLKYKTLVENLELSKIDFENFKSKTLCFVFFFIAIFINQLLLFEQIHL